MVRMCIPKILLLITFFGFNLMPSDGQDRTNREKLSFDKESEILTKATGWYYNSEIGEWVDYKNVLCSDKDYKTKYPSLLGEYMMSHRYQNFISIQTKTVLHRSNEYYVLIVNKWRGEYEYPSIREDWESYKVTFAFIFSPEEFFKLYNINEEVELRTNRVAVLGSKYKSFTESKFLDLIQNEIMKQVSSFSGSYKFPVRKAEDGSIRFLLPNTYGSFIKYDFDRGYFETDFENFAQILAVR